MTKERNSGIDMLKILLAWMVISIHFIAPATGHAVRDSSNSFIKLTFAMVSCMTVPAVNCYVLISSYFYYGKEISIRTIGDRLARLWLALVFYSVGGYAFTCICGYQNWSIFELIKRFFPLIRNEWWFMTVYFLLMITMPILNALVMSLTINTHRQIVIASFIICSFVFFFTKWEEDLGIDYGYSYLWFVVLFFIGSYMRRIRIADRIRHWSCLLGFVLCGIINLSVTLASTRVNLLNGYNVYVYNSGVVCIQAVLLFCFFLKNGNLERKYRFIPRLAGLSMASYLLHCQEDIGVAFWKMTNPSRYADSYEIFIIYLITALAIYSASIIIEFFRKKVINLCNFEDKLVSLMLGFFGSCMSRAEEVLRSWAED